jgi:hypothetical protein
VRGFTTNYTTHGRCSSATQAYAPVQEITHRLCAVRTPGLSLEPADCWQKEEINEVHMARPSRKLVYLESMMGAGLPCIEMQHCIRRSPREANAKREDNRAAHGLCDWRWPSGGSVPEEDRRTRKTRWNSVKRWMRWSGERISMPRQSASYIRYQCSGLCGLESAWPRPLQYVFLRLRK